MASTPEQVVCTPAFVFPAAFPANTEKYDYLYMLQGATGFDPRSHLANFHANTGATPPPPPPLQHQEDQKPKIQNRGGVKAQAAANDFAAGRNLLASSVPSAFPGIDTGKLAQGTVVEQKEDSKDKLWPCPSCKVPFKAASELQAHLSAHTKGEKTVPCDICGKLFASSERVRIHVRAAHGEKSCSCDICGSGFSYRCKLLDHMRTHTGDKPFHCDVCGKSFSQKNHLTRHSMIHTGERPYPCDFCGRGFYRKDKLTRHRRIHTVSPSTPGARHGRAALALQSSTSNNTNNPNQQAQAVGPRNNPGGQAPQQPQQGPNTSNTQLTNLGASPNSQVAASSSLNTPSTATNTNTSPSPNSPFRASNFKPDWQAPSGVH